MYPAEARLFGRAALESLRDAVEAQLIQDNTLNHMIEGFNGWDKHGSSESWDTRWWVERVCWIFGEVVSKRWCCFFVVMGAFFGVWGEHIAKSWVSCKQGCSLRMKYILRAYFYLDLLSGVDTIIEDPIEPHNTHFTSEFSKTVPTLSTAKRAINRRHHYTLSQNMRTPQIFYQVWCNLDRRLRNTIWKDIDSVYNICSKKF